MSEHVDATTCFGSELALPVERHRGSAVSDAVSLCG